MRKERRDAGKQIKRSMSLLECFSSSIEGLILSLIKIRSSRRRQCYDQSKYISLSTQCHEDYFSLVEPKGFVKL